MKSVAAILLIGGTIGAISNILLFRAVTIAPNPGLPVAIVNATSIGVFLAAGLLSKLAPNYFNSEKIDAWSLFGIILTIVGTSIIAIRK
jgi:drug/metabolite transporter (DMT)-like permease